MADSSRGFEQTVSRAEELIVDSLPAILDSVSTGDRIDESPELRDVLSALEYFIPEVLREIHPEWKDESLDGVFPLVTQKTGNRAVRIFGQCILITDQTIAPLLVDLQISSAGNRVSWLECKLGEKGSHGMMRTPYESPTRRMKLLHSLSGKHDSIDWAYKVTFGNKQPSDQLTL